MARDPSITSAVEGPGAQRTPVLMYHRIDAIRSDEERAYTVTPSVFANQMETLAEAGMSVCSADALVDWMCGERTVPDRSILLTFDDGYTSFKEHAAPVLRKLGWTASVFVVTSMLGESNTWIQRKGLHPSTSPLLLAEEIRELADQGFSFHSHSRQHPALTVIEQGALVQEIAASKMDLEDILRAEVRYFAYPYGIHDNRVVAAVREAGYKAAFSVVPGFNRPGEDLFRIRRLNVFGWDTPRTLLRKVQLGQNNGSLVSGIRYFVKRAGSRVLRS